MNYVPYDRDERHRLHEKKHKEHIADYRQFAAGDENGVGMTYHSYGIHWIAPYAYNIYTGIGRVSKGEHKGDPIAYRYDTSVHKYAGPRWDTRFVSRNRKWISKVVEKRMKRHAKEYDWRFR